MRQRAPALTFLVAAMMAVSGCATGSDPIAAGFARPPSEARPKTWWHWLNGNITAEGAKRDLEWMHRAGVGGVQIFEGSLGTPRVVDRPLVWMRPEWRAAIREAVKTAAQLGIDVQIASSPGWSITGAPFVAPEDAMKKLVWSRTTLDGGAMIGSMLPLPPSVAGPFQDVARPVPGGAEHYRDIAVLAFPAAEPDPRPVQASVAGNPMAIDALIDGRFGEVIDVPYDPETGTETIQFDFGKPVLLSSLTVGLDAPVGFGAPPAPEVVGEVSADGVAYRGVARLPHNQAQVLTASFAPVTVRYARIRLVGNLRAGGMPPVAPGVASLPPRVPSPFYRVSEARFGSAPQVDRWVEKAGFAIVPSYYAIPTPASATLGAVPANRVLNLTDRLRPDGMLDWTPPPGRWTILRLGHSLTGKVNGPAPVEATGLEVDKLDAGAVGRYIDTYLDGYGEAVGTGYLGKVGITGILSDSIESGPQNWTPDMINQFRRLRGYDPVPWLPALTGVVIESAEASDKFLWDYRATIADLVAQAHYATIAARLHARDLVYFAEALEDRRPQLGDDLAIRAQADVPMGALWWAPAGEPPRTTLIADVQGAASVASIYGKHLVGAESLTAFGRPWGFAPSDLKAAADLEFALGVNQIMLHTSPHQPLERAPGFALSPLLGQSFSRHETWADMARGWTDYLARASWMMRQGRHAADILWFVGEDAPVTALYGDIAFDGAPAGYGFDFVGADGLQRALSVARDGTLVSQGGVRYRLLVLGGSSKRMTLATLTRLAELVEDGATIVGERPEASPSLADDSTRWSALADRLWQAPPAGRGRVFNALDDALAALDLRPDWSVEGTDQSALAVRHRQLDDGELWFVANRSAGPVTGALSLRIAGRQAEWWDAVSGERRPAAYRTDRGRTIVPFDLAQSGSAFLVFRKQTRQDHFAPLPEAREELARWDDGWTMTLGGQAPTALDRLQSWTDLSLAEQRYFSGTGSYRRTIDVPPEWLGGSGRVLIDLGQVGDVAEVLVNGSSAGIVWTAPQELDIGKLLKSGTNAIEVRVANLWVNRLIGDAQPGATKQATIYGEAYTADAPLRPSGLMGPVRLVRRTMR